MSSWTVARDVRSRERSSRGPEGGVRLSQLPTSTANTLEFRSTVPAHALSVGFVRRAMQTFAEVFGEQRASDLGLIFTELVTNSIKHADLGPDGTIEVRLELAEDGASGAVIDGGRGFNADEIGPKPQVTGGLGLFIVERLVRRWGVERRTGQTKVWFDL
jgi:two-component sensor histidine kinase